MTESATCETMLTCEKGLSAYQVFQRSATGTASIDAQGVASEEGTVVAAVLDEGIPLPGFASVEIGRAEGGKWQGSLIDVPTGGPYTIRLSLVGAEEKELAEVSIPRVLVGDLWLLAGQSNMDGVGNMVDVEGPSDRVNVFRMCHEWDNAIEPVHRTYESLDSVHLLGQPRLARAEADRKAASQTKGAGLGLAFAKQMVARTGVPIGLVPTAHGGTSMSQWDPDLREKGEGSLYGSMLRSLKAVGGRISGVLWYQGESDGGDAETAALFPAKFSRFIESIREDAGDPDLPFYYVQISQFFVDHPAPQAWNAIQEHQRLAVRSIPSCDVVSAIDLDLDDLIHIGTPGLKTLGARLANLAVGQTRRGPRLEKIERVPAGLRVVYDEVNERLLPSGRVSGFSIRNASDEHLPILFKQTVDPVQPNCVLLYLTQDPPKGSQLYYGYGTMPFCNLTDAENMAALAFGPVAIPE